MIDYNEACRMVQAALPGVTAHLQIAEGEGVATSRDADGNGNWYVSYVRFVEDEAAQSGYHVEVRTLEREFGDAHEAGWEAGSLAEHLPKPAFFTAAEAPDDTIGRRLWQQKKLKTLKRRARAEVIEELKQEALSLVLLQGLTDDSRRPVRYSNQEENELWQVLEILLAESNEQPAPEEPGGG